MRTKTVLQWGISAFTLLTAATVVWAGGFGISIEPSTPQANNLPKGTVLVAKPYGCIKPSSATLSATAEGLVNGKRQTVPIKLTRVSPDTYAVQRQWPKEGIWLVAVQGEASGMKGTALVRMGRDGKVEAAPAKTKNSRDEPTPVYYISGDLPSGEIDGTLKNMAQIRNQTAKLSESTR